MTHREGIMVRALAGVAAAALLVLGIMVWRDAMAGLDREHSALRKQYELLLQRQPQAAAFPQESFEELKARKLEMEQRFYQPGEITVYVFSTEIQKRLAESGLAVKQLGIDPVKHELSLTVSGTVLAVLRFLHDIQLGPKFIELRTLMLQRAPDGSCQIQMRLRYVEIGS